MIFEENDERNEFLAARGRVILNACPGSGKTTTIAYKITQLTSEVESQYGKFSGIACLSFTNVAKDEINKKYKQFSGKHLNFPHAALTIDSFINSYITTPYIHLVENFEKSPKILDEAFIIDEMISEKYWYYNITKAESKYLRTYPPSKIEYRLDGTAHYPGGKDTSALYISYCNKVKAAKKKLGIIKSSDSEFFALKILNNYPKVGRWLAQRFPFIIIDEAQDTSEIQHAIFDKLISCGLQNIELIGDPYQSLYEWRDARPDLFYAKFNDTNNWTALNLNNCRRSSQVIIDLYKKTRLATDSEIISTAQISNPVAICIIKYPLNQENHCVEKFQEIISDYEVNHIVVRGRTMKNKLLGIINEDVQPWKTYLPYVIIKSHQHFLKKDLKSAVNTLRSILPILETPDIDHRSRKIRESELKENYLNNALIVSFLKGMSVEELTIEVWTLQTQQYLRDFFSLDNIIDFGLKKNPWGRRTDLITSIYNNPTLNSIPVSTIHQVKGMTFESLLLVLSPNSSGQNISLKDYITPTTFPEEKQRMLYVAMSRPSHLMAIGVPNTITDQKLKELFGSNVVIHECVAEIVI